MARDIEMHVTIRCNLGDEYFQEWDNLSPEIQIFWEQTDKQPNCEGTGEMRTWCVDCPFCDVFEAEEE